MGIISKIVYSLLREGAINEHMAATLKELPKELAPYLGGGKAAESLMGLSGAKLMKTAVAAPTFNPNEFYRPAVRLKSGVILHDPEARFHAEAFRNGLINKGVDPYKYDYSKIFGTGGIGPDGNYYEHSSMGDVPDKGEDLKMYLGGIK